jgi:hypothetical protein
MRHFEKKSASQIGCEDERRSSGGASLGQRRSDRACRHGIDADERERACWWKLNRGHIFIIDISIEGVDPPRPWLVYYAFNVPEDGIMCVGPSGGGSGAGQRTVCG